MAGAGYKLFNTGDVLTAAQVNTYLQEQAVMRFASAAARTTALSGVLAEGMVSYLMDTNAVEVYDGSAWVGVGNVGDITGVTAGTGISGGGTSGTVTITNSMATEITAAGDIIVGTGSATFDNLPIGTTGQVLTADTTVSPYKVKWATPSSGTPTFVGWSLRNSNVATGTFSCSNSTHTQITFNTENFDTDNFHSTTTNTSRVTIPTGKDGYYQINCGVEWDANATNSRYISLYKNGTRTYTSICSASSGSYPHSRLSTIINLVAGDYIEIYAMQDSGGTLSCYATTIVNPFTGVFLGA